MTRVPAERRYTIDEYLRAEYDAEQRHEYYDGLVVAMAGGSPQHSLIISNVIGELRNGWKGGPCRVYDSNLRVRVPRSRLYVYPDATVICGPTQHDADDPKRQTITNPKLIVEVLSDSTDHLDYGPKLRRYLECETLEEYVLVAQETPHVHVFFRQEGGTWLFTPVIEFGETVKLRSVGVDLPLREIYAGVEFPAEADEKADLA